MSLVNCDAGLCAHPLWSPLFFFSFLDNSQYHQRSAFRPAVSGLYQPGGTLHRRHGRHLCHPSGGATDKAGGETQRCKNEHTEIRQSQFISQDLRLNSRHGRIRNSFLWKTSRQCLAVGQPPTSHVALCLWIYTKLPLDFYTEKNMVILRQVLELQY